MPATATALLENTSERERTVICERVQEAISADPAAGTVTLQLVQPWAPLLARPQPALGRRDQPGMGGRARRLGWRLPELDGVVCTGSVGETPLATAILGSGPYVLDHWTPGREYVLTANNGYWRSNLNEMWAGGPAGRPLLQTIRVERSGRRPPALESAARGRRLRRLLSPRRYVSSPTSRSARCALLAADSCVAGPGAAGPLRRIGTAGAARAMLAIAFNFNITPSDNPYIGSGSWTARAYPQLLCRRRRAPRLCRLS
jgi:hypothetical protein